MEREDLPTPVILHKNMAEMTVITVYLCGS